MDGSLRRVRIGEARRWVVDCKPHETGPFVEDRKHEMTDISDLKVKMQALTRDNLLKIIAAAVVELTILGRFHYDDPDEQRWLRTVNEAVHKLSGHLRDLCDQNERYTPSRADGICEQLILLPEVSLKGRCGLTA